MCRLGFFWTCAARLSKTLNLDWEVPSPSNQTWVYLLYGSVCPSPIMMAEPQENMKSVPRMAKCCHVSSDCYILRPETQSGRGRKFPVAADTTTTRDTFLEYQQPVDGHTFTSTWARLSWRFRDPGQPRPKLCLCIKLLESSSQLGRWVGSLQLEVG